MCTVTVIPLSNAAGYRLACNRDESRARAEAEPPRRCLVCEHDAAMPIDPQSGGTWIAVNSYGLTATLLNANPPRSDESKARSNEGWADDEAARSHRRSRGEIVPRVMEAVSLDDAGRLARELVPSHYAPFTLVLVDWHRALAFRSNGDGLRVIHAGLIERPILFTSSGLGDHLVDPPRRALFDQMVVPADDWLTAQIDYHRHRWLDRPELSVCMMRDDARTVSLTHVTVDAKECRMTYWPKSPDQSSEPTDVTLPRHAGAGQ